MSQNDDGSPQSVFQLVLLAVFAGLGITGIALVALFRADEGSMSDVPTIVIWGESIDLGRFSAFANEMKGLQPRLGKVNYVSVPQGTLYQRTLEAIATGRAPDLVIIDQSNLLPLKNKLQPISYEILPVGTYRETFVEGAEIFALREGIYALPLAVDPLVLFWNRDLFTNAAVAQVPRNWDTVVQSVDTFTKRTERGDILQSTIPFGEYENVIHAKEILSALFLQSGTVPTRQTNSGFASGLSAEGVSLALAFYTDFSNPIKRVYSWNKTFDRSREAFATNKSALYAGFASEVFILPTINPNLNFDITVFPQSATRQNQVTYGKFYGIAIMNTSRHKARAYEVASILTSQQSAGILQRMLALPSVRRDSLTTSPTDPYRDTLVRSAIISRGWLEPNGAETDRVFRKMVTDVVSGRNSLGQAISTANTDLNILLETYGRQ